MVPGQEWTTIWEGDAADRLKSDLPMAHDVTITYEDSHGRRLENTYRLDWEAYRWRQYRVTRGIHDLAKSLDDVRGILNRVTTQNAVRVSHEESQQ